MSTKIYCDACGTLCNTARKFRCPCHLMEFRGKLGYIDGEGNPVSGRDNEPDVCTKCWNRIYGEAAKVFFQIQSETQATKAEAP